MVYDVRWSSRRLAARRVEAVSELSSEAVFTPGSVHQTWSKCGKPTCHCAVAGDPGHGPRTLWVRYEQGKTVTRTVPAWMADEVSRGVEAYQRFTDTVREIGEINAVLAERGLNPPGGGGGAQPGASGQKGGSRRRGLMSTR